MKDTKNTVETEVTVNPENEAQADNAAPEANEKAGVPNKVKVFLPKIPGEENTVFVGLNGKGYQVPRGKQVEVPAAVAEILNNVEKNREYAEKYSEEQKAKMHVVQGAPG